MGEYIRSHSVNGHGSSELALHDLGVRVPVPNVRQLHHRGGGFDFFCDPQVEVSEHGEVVNQARDGRREEGWFFRWWTCRKSDTWCGNGERKGRSLVHGL
jgi:hypothetical protein